MRGFFTFLLALAVLSAVFLSASAYSSAKARDSSGLLVLEKKYYYEQAVKRALLDSAKYAASEAERQYLEEAALAAAGGGQIPAPNDTIGERIRKRVHERLADFSLPDEEKGEWDLALWCGQTSEQDMQDIAVESRRNGIAKYCPTCHAFSDAECADYINVNPVSSELWLGSGLAPGWGTDGVVGFTLYNRKNGFASTAYIPKTAKVGY
jgi:hypothetical protein